MFNLYSQDFIRSSFAQLVPDVGEIYRVKESSWNCVYHVHAKNGLWLGKIGPVPGGSQRREGVANEYRALSGLARRGISCVPAVKGYAVRGGTAVSVVEFIRRSGLIDPHRLGMNLARVHAMRRRFSSGMKGFWLSWAGRLQEQARDLDYAGRIGMLDSRLEPHRREIFKEVWLMLGQLDRAVASLAEFDVPQLSFIMMDTADVAIPRDGEVFLVDWHLSGYGDPAWDLVRLIDYESSRGDFDVRTFLAGYRSAGGNLEGAAIRMGYYRVLAELAAVLYAFGDEEDLVKYRASPLVVSSGEKMVLGKSLLELMDRRMQQARALYVQVVKGRAG